MPSLRVIGGIAKGRKLRSVPGDTTRPITDRTKESLFNIIGADIINSSFLDLFAGTGSVGIEALSRGARFVRFIDAVQPAVTTIRQNLTNTGFLTSHTEYRFEVLMLDSFRHLNSTSVESFDYIYIAPPQYKDLWKRALLVIDNRIDWLTDDGWIIVQIHPVEYLPLDLAHLEEFDQRRYGSTMLVFYRGL